jgi:two-component system, NarL family, nitrate/nitrite response regulator NarL
MLFDDRKLTNRERQIVALVCGGLSNKTIAHRPSPSEGTVKAHVRGIFQKLSVRSRCELIVPASDRASDTPVGS